MTNISEDSSGNSQLSTGIVAAIVIVCVILFILILGLGFYAWNQKKSAERAKFQNSPFGIISHYSFILFTDLGTYQCKYLPSTFFYFQHHGLLLAKELELHHKSKVQDGFLFQRLINAQTNFQIVMKLELEDMAR